MDGNVKVYHNPRCVTCRRSIERLKVNRVEFELQDFFKDKLTKQEIVSLLKMAGISVKDALRKKDKMYKALKLDKKQYSDNELIVFMEKYPGLILRPIMVKDNRAVIANKPEIADAFCKRGTK
ncbi:MAG: arsenate reductase family protein [Nitrososphaerales archaeon]